ncbi:MAG: type I 3-dehydroquinate dehydratase [Halarchaeum sp.]
MPFDDFTLCAATDDLADEPRAREHADAVEFRLDHADGPLDELDAYSGDLPILATNPHVDEGGAVADDAERLDVLAAAAEYDAVGAVAIELDAMRDGRGERVAEAARANDASVVVAAHDFEGTPLRQDLRGILGNALEYGDVAKLATTATDRVDVLDLVTVTHEFDYEGEKVATMAMGEAGRHSRAVLPLYGSRIGYAPVDPADATASGQYDAATLRRLVDDLTGA